GIALLEAGTYSVFVSSAAGGGEIVVGWDIGPAYATAYLGEAAAEFFFSNIPGITLQEVEPEHFESFDFKLINAQNQVCYVDAKFWKIGPQLPDKEEQQRIAEKLHRCGGTRAIVINFYPAESEPDNCLLTSRSELVIIPAAFVGDKPWQAAVKALKEVL
ncbi:MAG: hypothetical protein WHT84_10345, partial [Breznakiellaceae bacterium]